MSLPKHKNPRDRNGELIAERTASAPYNFVPLPDKVVTAVSDANDLADHNTFADERYPHSGYFDVTLTTKSPIYVRCPFTLGEFLRQERGKDGGLPFQQQVKNSPQFFYTRSTNQPVIPGSSLRGMLRSLLEIVSYGKINKVTNRNLIYRAVGDSTALGSWYREQTLGSNQSGPPHTQLKYPSTLMKGGYLCRHNGQWTIRPAREHHNESFIHVEYSAAQPIIGGRGRWRIHDVFVTPAPRVTSNRGRRGPGNLTLELAVASGLAARRSGASAPAGMVPAVLVESGHMDGAHAKHMHCAVYEEDPQATLIPIPHEMWETYQEDRDMTRGNLTAGGDPLFYLLDDTGRLVFFGSTMMFRLPYQRSIHQLIPESLRQPLVVDYADALLGFVREKKDFASRQHMPPQGSKERSYASRVFVTDAVLASEIAEGDLWLTGDSQQALTPRILASPKPTSFQLYLVQPEPGRSDLSHYDSPTKDANGVLRGRETVIRGHKRYWHQGLNEENGLSLDQVRQMIEEQGPVPPNDTQHTRFKPVKPEVRFRFRVHFENLSERELGALCWTLHPLGDRTITYCHHLGMGKPLGMGAVKMDARLTLTNRQRRYGSLFDGNDWQFGTAGSEEDLSDRATLERRTHEFEQQVLGELGLAPACAHLSDTKRIGMLLKTMEWPGYRAEAAIPGNPPPNNCVLTENNKQRPNTRYMTIQLPGVPGSQRNEYRDRPILPDPEAFGPLTGVAEPAIPDVPASAPQVGTERTSSVSSTKTQPPAVVSATEMVGSVKQAIAGLRGAGDVSLVESLVKRIAAITSRADRQECALLLQSWLKAQKLWNKEKHAAKAWHVALEELLQVELGEKPEG